LSNGRYGAVRFRPILLALAARFGSWVITLDPIFSGLAWSFYIRLFASTAFSLVVVVVIFYLQASRQNAGKIKAQEYFQAREVYGP
jgi:multidrug efflux pump subunit AcrB